MRANLPVALSFSLAVWAWIGVLIHSLAN